MPSRRRREVGRSQARRQVDETRAEISAAREQVRRQWPQILDDLHVTQERLRANGFETSIVEVFTPRRSA